MKRIPIDETLLIEQLSNPNKPGSSFSVRVDASKDDHYIFRLFPAQEFTALNAYDSYFVEKRNTALVRQQPIKAAIPSLRADDAITPDFLASLQKQMTKSGEEKPLMYGEDAYFTNTYDPARISHSLGRIGFINGYHRTRVMYSFGMKQIPVFIDNHKIDTLEERLKNIRNRMDKNKTLFPFQQVLHDFQNLPSPKSLAEFKENTFMFFKFATARKPEDMFLHKKDFY